MADVAVSRCFKMKYKTDTLTICAMACSIGPYNEKLPKVLATLWDSVVTKYRFVSDSFAFCQEIQEVSSKNKFLIAQFLRLIYNNSSKSLFI